jgi:hypothetical protein
MDVITLARVVAIVTTAPLLPGTQKTSLPPLPPPPLVAADSGDPCEAPFSYDMTGIKHYVLSCLEKDRAASFETVPDCTLPYQIDAVGNHHYVDACLEGEGDRCAVPFTFTSDGIKRFTLECL